MQKYCKFWGKTSQHVFFNSAHLLNVFKITNKSGGYVLVREKQMTQMIVYDECSFTYAKASYRFAVHHLLMFQ